MSIKIKMKMNTKMNIKKIPLLVFLSFLWTASCSNGLIGFIYDRVDNFAFNKIDSYFDLNDAQELMLHSQINQLHSWHRTNELQNYADILRYYSRSSEDALTASEYYNIVQSFKQRRDVLMEKIIPVTVNFLYTLSPEQIEHLQKKLQEENEKEKKETPQERAKKQYRLLRNVYSYLTGGLQTSQLTKLKSLTEKFSEQSKLNEVAERKFIEQRQQDFVTLLNEHGKNKQQLEKTLRYWMLPFEKSFPPYFQKISQGYENFMKNLLISMDNSLSDSQRQYMRKKINSLAEDIEAIAASQ